MVFLDQRLEQFNVRDSTETLRERRDKISGNCRMFSFNIQSTKRTPLQEFTNIMQKAGEYYCAILLVVSFNIYEALPTYQCGANYSPEDDDNVSQYSPHVKPLFLGGAYDMGIWSGALLTGSLRNSEAGKIARFSEMFSALACSFAPYLQTTVAVELR